MFECFCCPVCGQALIQEGQTLRCSAGHSFDLASGGYVNLWVTNRTHAGDSKGMVTARHRFLESGAYGFLLNRLCSETAAFLRERDEQDPLIVDAGCGEGYYTAGIAAHLRRQGIPAAVAGIDISKAAVRTGAKRGEDVSLAVASLFKLPLRPASADIVLSVFAPVCGAECARVLKPGGVLFIVSPGPKHLFGLKEILYDNPYENPPNSYYLPGFRQARQFSEKREILVRGGQMNDLFAMTPYYWKTPADASARLAHLPTLTTSLDFHVDVYERCGDGVQDPPVCEHLADRP